MSSDNFAEKYRMYSIAFDHGLAKRMIMVHINRPTSFKGVMENYIFNNMELTIEKTNEKLRTSEITAVQKIPNDNPPLYELTMDGMLKEIL